MNVDLYTTANEAAILYLLVWFAPPPTPTPTPLLLDCVSADTEIALWLMFLQTNDPMVRISLENYESIFSVTPHGIARYLTLVKPVDREEQKSYSFTVRSTQAQVISISSFLGWAPLRIIEITINNWAQFDKIQVLQTTLYY